MKKTLLTLALLTSALGFAHTHVDVAGVFVKSETEQLPFKTELVFETGTETFDIVHEELGVMTFSLVDSNADEETATLKISIKAKNTEGELVEVSTPVIKAPWNKEAKLTLGNSDTNETLSITITVRND